MPIFSTLLRQITPFALALYPAEALAHSTVPGIDGFSNGLLHLVLTPGPAPAIVALGLMLGLSWPKHFAPPASAFAVSMLCGLILGQFIKPMGAETGVLFLVSFSTATLSALYPAGFLAGAVTLAALGGLMIGLISTPDPGSIPATLLMLLGSFAGANLALFYTALCTGWLHQRFPQKWIQFGVRIIAAWIAAISLIMAALNFAPE